MVKNALFFVAAVALALILYPTSYLIDFLDKFSISKDGNRQYVRDELGEWIMHKL